jgi:hypothetical protein
MVTLCIGAGQLDRQQNAWQRRWTKLEGDEPYKMCFVPFSCVVNVHEKESPWIMIEYWTIIFVCRLVN